VYNVKCKEVNMIKIVVDSTGYIPEEVLERHDIKVVPLKIRFGNEEFKFQAQLTLQGLQLKRLKLTG